MVKRSHHAKLERDIDEGLDKPHRWNDPVELWPTGALRAEVKRRLDRWRPALKDVRFFGELMDELSERTKKTWDELKAELQ